MGLDNLARAALIASIPALYALGSLQLWHVFVLSLLAAASGNDSIGNRRSSQMQQVTSYRKRTTTLDRP
jgi:hypothetical protein